MIFSPSNTLFTPLPTIDLIRKQMIALRSKWSSGQCIQHHCESLVFTFYALRFDSRLFQRIFMLAYTLVGNTQICLCCFYCPEYTRWCFDGLFCFTKTTYAFYQNTLKSFCKNSRKSYDRAMNQDLGRAFQYRYSP